MATFLFFWLLLFLMGAAFFISAGVIWYLMAVWEYSEPVEIICPETMESASVRIDGKHAARTRFAGHEELRIASCSRWPGRDGCSQACWPQVPLVGDDRTHGKYAPFGLQPESLRINSPVRMSKDMYSELSSEFERELNRPKAS